MACYTSLVSPARWDYSDGGPINTDIHTHRHIHACTHACTHTRVCTFYQLGARGDTLGHFAEPVDVSRGHLLHSPSHPALSLANQYALL